MRTIAVALALTVAGGGCTRASKGDAGSTSDAPSSSGEAPMPAPSGARGADEIRPVYPVNAGPVDPLAQRFCGAVVTLPERRRAECCASSSAVAGALAGSCERALGFSLAQHAVTLSPAAVDRCVEAMTSATAGCDWVTPEPTASPPECQGIIQGALSDKARCRSSLECPDGERCLGLSTVDLGTCGPPRAERSPCNVAVDTLATFARQDDLDRAHPECAGYCKGTTCVAAIPGGGPCAFDAACGDDAHCAAGKCVAGGRPAIGDACAGACAFGARCANGRCAAPHPEGAGCSSDDECRGACVRADGGSAGTCAKVCPSATVPVFGARPTRLLAPSVQPGGHPPPRP